MDQAVNGAMTIETCRSKIRDHYLADEYQAIHALIDSACLSVAERGAISSRAAELVRRVRYDSTPTLMERFLAEYGLATKEGVALMCLAEALLRVPDKTTIDELIEDKVTSGNWGEHRGQSDSFLINSSTWALLVTGKLISPVDQQGLVKTLRSMIKRMGEPVVRTAVAQAMKELGRQFVLGRSIDEATDRAKKREKQGFTYSYDMLGEAARTAADAERYFNAYSAAIESLAGRCQHQDIRLNPGISVKLSALHPRYEFAKQERVQTELVERVRQLALQAKQANMGFNIDAEEADRLDISLDIIEATLSDPMLEGWEGFGVVVQAYGPRAPFVIDWLYALSHKLDRNIMVRLVKGAYWDAEIKRAQTLGMDGFPVYTRKACSDVSYISCAQKLLTMTDRIYPQFATHNAHSVAAILELAGDSDSFEFQRLHGMGESLHDVVAQQHQTRCRIYAPVGAHQDLLAYLVRRLLENGANSSFVNQIVDKSIAPEMIAQDPFELVESLGTGLSSQAIAKPADLYGEERPNAKGWDWNDPVTFAEIDQGRATFSTHRWQAGPMIAGDACANANSPQTIYNPAQPADQVGEVTDATGAQVEQALGAARQGFEKWSAMPVAERSACVQRVADLYEEHAYELFALTIREAGKTIPDAIAELREAVDFARYYALEAERNDQAGEARGVISCISPWNFPLAIFSGQILAALAAGNAVVAKPAETTVLIAARAVELMHEAGIPVDALQLLPGSGATVGAALTIDARVDGVCFTGSTETAQKINRVMAEGMAPEAPLVAETGGLNVMIVDSTALPEQVIRDVVASAFQSAGQRCSALRMLYLQRDIADHVIEMLCGAMDELALGNPWQLATDIGPVIDSTAQQKIEAHCETFRKQGRIIKSLPTPAEGYFVPPTLIRLDSIDELEQEIFGPVLHVATFEADEIDQVVDRINGRGFGLTFGLHTRVDARVARITDRVKVGNLYVNRNQIGAIVGSQPFGGEGLSGTGPKAGGPQYVRRFMQQDCRAVDTVTETQTVTAEQLQQAIDQVDFHAWVQAADRTERLQQAFGSRVASLIGQPETMPGPTGELNVLSCHPRGVVLCLGPDRASALSQACQALAQGNAVVVIADDVETKCETISALGLPLIALDGQLEAQALVQAQGYMAVASAATTEVLRRYRKALADRDGALLPLITESNAPERFVIERHLCVDTTAAGGNASLIAASE